MELSLFLSIISGFIAFYSVMLAVKRNNQKDAGQIAMILEKLTNISMGIAELKEELSNLNFEQSNLKVRLAGLETSVSLAHKRIDEMKK
ncbi:MAG: hypothetical protein IJR47_02555 [Clostridia bacterium]|nr:hypothetical protein [Clostridia bacterium]